MTDRYAVIVNSIGHTKSPLIHGLFAQATGRDMDYTAIEGPLAPARGFEAAVLAFRDGGGRGMNVTAPFKLRAFEMADERSERAVLSGAVNALMFSGGRILAENFDGVGLLRDIEVNLGLPLAGRRVLMFGAGGAARGALLPFLAARPRELVLANRDVDKAAALARQVGPKGRARLLIRRAGRQWMLRPGGQRHLRQPDGQASAGAALGVRSGRHGLRTGLRQGAHALPAAGAQRRARGVADGVGMLVEQAAEASAWWRGVRPATDAAIDQLTVPLN
jgi:shikimate dehydrogenase